LAELAPEAVHDATGTLLVLLLEQVVVVQLFDELAEAAVHEATGTFVVTTGAGHVVVVQLLLAWALLGEHEPTGTLVVLLVPQVVWV
jgi:hypothetical protein